MADIGDRLRIKYGLRNNPTQSSQSDWAALTRERIRAGTGADAAGRASAARLFSDFNQVFYASEGDTIEMLLRQIEDR